MAEYHFSGSLVQRSKGQSSVARAAYNARQSLFDARLGLTWDYSRKRDCEHRAIYAPPNAPQWALRRESLWNAAEAAEGRRCNAQVARSFHVGLPRELSAEAHKDLVRSFVVEEFVRRGMVADVAIHRDDANPHFHLLVTMRELEGDGFAATKQRAWNRSELLVEWREAWERHANLALARGGHAERIDNRSYRERGIPLEPQPKLFRRKEDAALDARDHVRERRLALEAVARANGERIIASPQVALDALTSKQSTFTRDALLRLLHRHTADASQFGRALAAVTGSEELRVLQEGDGNKVLYSTRAIIARESALLADSHLLAARSGHRVRSRYVDQAVRLAPHQLTEEQVKAVRHIAMTGDLALVQGFAGTGKSSLLATAKLAWEGEGYTVVGGALTGKAADGLAAESHISARTIKAWLRLWDEGQSALLRRHVFVLDEAGMVGTADFQRIVHQVRKAGAKLVLVGDVEQLQPIEIGAPMRMLQERYPAAKLTQIMRQRGHDWQRMATLSLATRDTKAGIGAYLTHERVHRAATAESAYDQMVHAWSTTRRQSPLASSLLLAFRRKDVRELNLRSRAARHKEGELGVDHNFETCFGTRPFAVNDRIVFLRNNADVKNGSLGTVEHIASGKLAVRLDDQRKIVIDPARYNHFDHGYATTISKSQGMTVDYAFTYASRFMDSASTYVALSRHRQDAALFFSSEEFESEQKLIRQLSRRRSKKMALDMLDHNGVARALRTELLRPERAFVDAVTPDPHMRLAAIRPIAMQPPLSRGNIMKDWAYLPTDDLKTAQQRAESAYALRQSEWRALENPTPAQEARARQDLEASREAYQEATLALYDRHRPKTLDGFVSRHNAHIASAQSAIAELRESDRVRLQQQRVHELISARNSSVQAVDVRGLGRSDEGVQFEVRHVLLHDGITVLELTDPRGGPKILTPASACYVHGRTASLARPDGRDANARRMT